MKSFFWRLFFCLAPLAVSALIVGIAFKDYFAGQGGFKLGVDLVGGTILIYEVDVSKFPGQKLPDDWKPQELAERLKKRIDPNDLYNVTVRAASQTRFEIILPTGGYHQIHAEDEAWNTLLKKVEDKFPVKAYKVDVGEEVELLAAINAQLPDKDENDKTPAQRVEEVRQFIQDHYRRPDLFGFPLPARTALARKAWQVLLHDAAEKYLPRGYTAGRGNSAELQRQVTAQKDDLTPDERIWLDKLLIEAKQGGTSLTTEKIAEVKNLLSQVGSLEFLILASTTYDLPAITAAQEQFSGKQADKDKFKKELDDRAFLGLPPPPPATPSGDKLFVAKNEAQQDMGRFTYSWVELGAAYRREHGLANPREPGHPERLLDPDKDAAEIQKLIDRDASKPGKEQPYVNVLRAAKARKEVVPFPLGDNLIFSREVLNPRQKDLDARDPKKAKRYEYFILTRDPEDPSKRITGDYLSGARAGDNYREIDFTFKPAGASLFFDFTTKNRKQTMAIVLDRLVESAATIQSPISDSGRITGSFTREQIDQTVRVLRAGALPATLKPEPASESTMGPTLGADTIKWGAISVLLAFAAVLVFMLVYYRFAGFVACVALLANLLMTVAFMVLIQATFTLPGLAGLVLMLGMAVDANILIYERLREERDRGANLAMALRNGYDRALPTIIDTHLTSIFTAIVLWVVGNDQLKGFGISLTVGLVISLFTSLYVTWTMFDFWRTKNWLHSLTMMEMFKTPKIPFMKIRYYWFAATAILTVLGAALFIWRLDSGVLNIDFMGGTAYSAELTQEAFDQQSPATIDRLRKALEDSGLPDLTVEQIYLSDPDYSKGDVSRLFTVRTSERSIDVVRKRIADVLGEPHPDKGRPWSLKNSSMRNVRIAPNGQVVTFEFYTPDPKDPSKGLVTEVSRAQVALGLQGRFRAWTDKLNTLSDKVPMLPVALDPELGLSGAEKDDKDALARRQKDALAQLDFGEPSWDSEATRQAAAALLADLSQELRDPAVALSADALKDPERRKDLGGRLEKLNLSSKAAAWRESAKLLGTAGQQFVLSGLGRESDGRFQWMKLTLVQPLSGANREYLDQILKQTEDAFRNPQPERLENFDSQLARDTQLRALYAILASWAAILLFLWFRCGSWTFGLAAVVCLVHDLFFTLGIIAACHYLAGTGFGNALGLRDFKIDLPAVAALLTLVGYSVSDTIVVFDRIREVRGKNPALTPKMIDDSVNQTLSRTLLTAASVALVVLVLYIFGGEGVHLFAFVMVVGVVVGTYSSIYIASPLLLLFGEGGKHSAAAAAVRTPEPAAEATTSEGGEEGDEE